MAQSLRSMMIDREVLGTGLGCRGVAPAVSVSKASHLYVRSLDPGVNEYLVGQ